MRKTEFKRQRNEEIETEKQNSKRESKRMKSMQSSNCESIFPSFFKTLEKKKGTQGFAGILSHSLCLFKL